MQIREGCKKILTLNTLILSVILTLGFTQPTVTKASNGSITTSSSQSITDDCETQDCSTQHTTCLQHCLDDSNVKNSLIIALPQNVHDQLIPPVIFEQIKITYSQLKIFFITDSTRAPPTLVFLRSVIKRE